MARRRSGDISLRGTASREPARPIRERGPHRRPAPRAAPRLLERAGGPGRGARDRPGWVRATAPFVASSSRVTTPTASDRSGCRRPVDGRRRDRDALVREGRHAHAAGARRGRRPHPGRGALLPSARRLPRRPPLPRGRPDRQLSLFVVRHHVWLRRPFLGVVLGRTVLLTHANEATVASSPTARRSCWRSSAR